MEHDEKIEEHAYETPEVRPVEVNQQEARDEIDTLRTKLAALLQQSFLNSNTIPKYTEM